MTVGLKCKNGILGMARKKKRITKTRQNAPKLPVYRRKKHLLKSAYIIFRPNDELESFVFPGAGCITCSGDGAGGAALIIFV